MQTTISRINSTGRELAQWALSPFFRSRRVDVCCCGLSKTGTHSMSGLFENYRCRHHPDVKRRLALALRYLQGEISVEFAQNILRKRDRAMRLEMESSSLTGILIEPLLAACPDKRFILTIRDVYSWCDSWLDHNINSPTQAADPWATLDRVRLRVNDFPPGPFDAPLVERGFPSLTCFFQLWARHNEVILRAVPKERLLVVRTHEIASRITDISAWLGVPVESFRADRAWLSAAPKKHRVLRTLEASYVRELADRFCGAQMKAYFPDVSFQSGA